MEDTVSAYPYAGSPEEFEKAFNQNMPRDRNGKIRFDAMPVINTRDPVVRRYTFYQQADTDNRRNPASVSFNASSELFIKPYRRGSDSYKSIVINPAENRPQGLTGLKGRLGSKALYTIMNTTEYPRNTCNCLTACRKLCTVPRKRLPENPRRT